MRHQNEGCSEQSSDEDDDDPVPVSTTIKTYNEAIATANSLLLFLTQKGEEEISEQLSTAITSLEHATVRSMAANSIVSSDMSAASPLKVNCFKLCHRLKLSSHPLEALNSLSPSLAAISFASSCIMGPLTGIFRCLASLNHCIIKIMIACSSLSLLRYSRIIMLKLFTFFFSIAWICVRPQWNTFANSLDVSLGCFLASPSCPSETKYFYS